MRPNRLFAQSVRRAARALTLALALLPGLVSFALAQTPAQATVQEGVQVGLEGARLVDFIRFLGQFLGGPPVLREDQVPPVLVSVVSPQPMAEGEVRELLGLVLRPVGLEAVQRGGVSYVLPAVSAGPGQPGQSGAPLPPDVRILAWRLAAGAGPGRAQALAAVLESLRSDRGQVLWSGRLIVLADEAARVARLRPVLQTLSALPPDQAPEIVPLVRAQARQAARALTMQMSTQHVSALTVLPLDWSNSLLLAGTPQALEQARALAAQADGAGPEAPVLRAYRTRHVRPDRLLEALREKLAEGAPDPRADMPRLRLDEGGQAVLALASPEALARLDRLVEALDQPRPRVYIEALVAELSPEASATLSLASARDADPGPAQAGRVGTGVLLQGRVVDAAQLGMEALAALLGREEGVRVLSVPRLAVFAGAEAKVSGGAGAEGQGGAERFRLALTPRLEPGQGGAAGRVLLRVVLEDGHDAGRSRSVEAALSEGEVLLVGGLAAAAQPGGWAVLSAPRKGEEPWRLVVVASARVVRPAAPGRGAGPSGRTAAGANAEQAGREAADKQ